MLNRFCTVSACAATVCSVFAIGCRSYRESIEAEETLHAYYLVMDVVTVFVKANEGTWPKSWDELKSVSPAREHAVWAWPDDLSQIAQRVEVDFGVIPDWSEPESFSAIRQLGPRYGPDKVWVKELLLAIHSATKEE